MSDVTKEQVRRKPRLKQRTRLRTVMVSDTRLALLERIGTLATELCCSIDRESEDIGGGRPSLTILQEIGPLTDQLEEMDDGR